MKVLISIGLFTTYLMLIKVNAPPAFAQADRPNKVSLSTSTMAPAIGIIKSKMDSGCGCYLELARKAKNDRKPVFAYLFDNNPIATMNIDGQDIKLRQVGKRNKSFETFKNDDVTVTLKYSLFKNEYEGGQYNVKISVKRGKKSSVVSTTGYCGC